MIGRYKPKNNLTKSISKESILILMPTYKWLPTETFSSFLKMIWKMKKKYHVDMHIVENTLIGEARNKLINDAINGYLSKVKYDYVLWCDSDHIFDISLFETLKNDITRYNLDMVSALYFSRRSNDIKPIAMVKSDKDGKYHNLLEIPENKLIEIDACGFGFFLMKSKVLLDVFKKYKYPFTEGNIHNVGEDILFLNKAEEFGYKAWIDTGCVIRHYGGSVGMEEYLVYRTKKGELKNDAS